MSKRTLSLTDALADYLLSVSPAEPDLLVRLRAETAALPHAGMQIAPEQGHLLRVLVTLLGARRCLEVGTFTGYSALVTADAMPDDGRLICCDISEEYTSIARRYWAQAGVEHKIDLRIGPALDTLDALLAGGGAGGFDFAFVDADKENYAGYYARCLDLLRPGGLLALDNVLWGGAVIDPTRDDEETEAIRAINAAIARDQRVTAAMVPIGDGLTLAVKR